MRVAVLGAGGTIAPAIVRDLAESDEVDSLSLLDLDLERAAAVAEAHGKGKATASVVDARGEGGLSAALADADVLVNSASYRINLDAMGACLDAGCHYLDLGGLYHVAKEQLELHEDFEKRGLLALLGIGSAPGKTNLMGLMAKRDLGEVEAMHVSAAGRDLDPPPGFSVPYALRTILDELTMPAVVVRDGVPTEVAALDPGGVVDFGDPIGEAETIHTLHTETLTFPTSFDCREVSFRLSLHPGVVERVRELADASEDEVDAAARSVAHSSPQTVAVHLVEAVGAGRGVAVRAVTEPMAEWGIGGGVVSTASPAAAAVRLLARGEITARGALSPELCLDPETMFGELESRGCTLETRIREAGRT
jgi:saccharopine dehydrogenase (NAD+, L-lysine-forming)